MPSSPLKTYGRGCSEWHNRVGRSTGTYAAVPDAVVGMVLLVPRVVSLPDGLPRTVDGTSAKVEGVPVFVRMVTIHFTVRQIVGLARRAAAGKFALTVRPNLTISPTVQVACLNVIT